MYTGRSLIEASEIGTSTRSVGRAKVCRQKLLCRRGCCMLQAFLLPLAMATVAPRSEKLATHLQGAPRIGLGMAALGRPGYINLGHNDDLPAKDVEAMRMQAHEVLDEAYRLGIRYIDCARSYGLSEEFVASWLAKQPTEIAAEVVVGSKWGYECARRSR